MVTHPTIPPELVPRILALKDWLGECWPPHLKWVDSPTSEVDLSHWMLGDRERLAYFSAIVYDLLLVACVRALQREGYSPLLTPKGEVVVCVAGTFIGLPQFTQDPDQLTNLISACEWAKERDASGGN